MRRNNLVLLTALVALMGVATSAAAAAAASGSIDSTLVPYQTVSAQFGDNVRSLAARSFWLFFGVQFAWSAIQNLLKRAEIDELLFSLVRSMLSAGFWFGLLEPLRSWLPTIVASFVQYGKTGAGVSELSPSLIVAQAGDLIDVMLVKFNSTDGFLSLMKNFFPSLMLLFAAILILFSFLVLAWQMALTMINGYFWLAVSPILLSFGATQWTRDIAVNSLKGGITIGMKIVSVYLVVAVAGTLAPTMGDWINQVTLTNWSPIWQVAFSAGLLAVLSWQLPKLAADLMNGTASLSAGDAAQTAAMTAGGIAGAAAVGGAAVAGGAGAALGAANSAISGASGLAQALGAGFEAAGDFGKTGMEAAAHAAGEVASHGLGIARTSMGGMAESARASFDQQVASSTGGRIAQSIQASRGGSIGQAKGGTATGAVDGDGQANAASPSAGQPGSSGAEASGISDDGGKPLMASLGGGAGTPAAGAHAAGTEGAAPDVVPSPSGDATSASLEGASPAGDSGGLTSRARAERGPGLQQRIRDIGNQIPQDQHTVGLAANLGQGSHE